MTLAYENTESCALELDEQDSLRTYQERFLFPKKKNGDRAIYFCGNSLGLQPTTASQKVEQVLKAWHELGVESWFEQPSRWLEYHTPLQEQLARLVGAKSSEIAIMNTLTVNLHLMMVSFYRPKPGRAKILIEKHAFPSDQYAVKSQIRFHGFDPEQELLEIGPREGEDLIRSEDIEALLDREGPSIALILLGGINYYTGQVFPMKKIAELGHAQGCVVGFDLAHVAGNIKPDLHDWNVDFATWCNYKYLNAGPGGISACFIHERHHGREDLPRFEGWWGNRLDSRFQMAPDYDPGRGAEAWVLSTSPMLPLALLAASLEIFDEIGMVQLGQKRDALTGYLEFLLDDIGSDRFTMITPRNLEERGSQLSILAQQHGRELFEALVAEGVICDWREPNVIRLAPVPLYNSFRDVYEFARILKEFR